MRKCVEVHRHCENCEKNLDSDFYRIDEVILNGEKKCDVCTSLHWTWEGSYSQSYLSHFSLFLRNMWKILDSDFQMNFHMKDSHEWKNVSYNVGNSLRTWGGLKFVAHKVMLLSISRFLRNMYIHFCVIFWRFSNTVRL